MIIGIYVVSGDECVGGGYVYQQSLLNEIVRRQKSNSLKHEIVFFRKGEIDVLNDEAIVSVNTEWYNGRLYEAALRHQIDIMWFLSVSYEEIDIPHILPVWDLQHRLQAYFPEVSSGGEFASRENFYNHFLPRATYILAGTEEGKKEISFFYRIPADRIVVNPLFPPQNISKTPIDEPGELKYIGLKKNSFIFYPAQFWPHKNHIVLLETIKILKSEYNTELKVILTGSDYGNMGYITHVISELGLENDVLLPGFVSEESILWLYQNAFALVYPSYFGPDNIPPIEAFSAGCPVIAANVSGAEEQLGDAAILVDPQYEVGFANAIMKLMQKPLLRESLIQKGYARAETRTAEHYVQNVLDTIDGFSSVRRCWGSHYKITQNPKFIESINYYLKNKELHSLVTLLSMCSDPSFEEKRTNITTVFNEIVIAHKNAEDAIARCEFSYAFEILNNILAQCVDYAPVYLSLSKIYYAQSDIDKAFECTKKSGFYNSVTPSKNALAENKNHNKAGQSHQTSVSTDSQSTPAPAAEETEQLVKLIDQGLYAEAEVIARRHTTLFPHHGISWKILGVVHKLQGRIAESLESMRKAVLLLPMDAGAHSNLGITLNELGLLEEAEASYLRALEIEPDYAEAHSNLGNTLKNMGKLKRAEASYRRALEIRPDFIEALNNLGNTLKDMGQLEEAEAICLRALEVKPDLADTYFNLGIILCDLGQLEQAEARYRRALEINSDIAEVHSNLGGVLEDLGRLEEAGASYQRALEIKPDFAHAHYNLGNIFRVLGRVEEAEACYRHVLEVNPDSVEAYNNLGITLKNMGRLEEAEACYRRALQIRADYVEVLNNLASLLYEQGKTEVALNIVKQSLQNKETEVAKSIFIACVKHMSFTQDDSEVRSAVVRALSEPWGAPIDLVRVGIELVTLNPDIGECIALAVNAWPQRLSMQELFGSSGLSAIASEPLLFALLNSAPLCDLEMERFLTMARWAMLEDASVMMPSGGEVTAAPALKFYSALARQCFINEYVFSHTDAEIQKASVLRDSLVAALRLDAQVPVLWPMLVAAYFPLCSLPFAARLLDRQWPEAVIDVLVQQVIEPEQEVQERAGIPRLTSIEDEVSVLVQNQYEENPYPRWIKAAPAGKPKKIVAYLTQKFPLAAIKPHGKGDSVDILIAGCGTGQHSIGTAQRFRGAQVLAVDLSMSSLCYAKRKTRELGLNSIEYAQADLLKLGSLGRSFDVVESSGVLHHLADPWAGWHVLLSLLRPDGFMKLGFYSAVARRNIVRIRTFIAEQGYGTTADEIRRCRQDLMDLDKNMDFKTTTQSADFFSISTCRDLLFHVQEHRMTLTSIDEFLQNNNLVFLGFDLDPQVANAYKRRFPNDRAATNLAQWQIFENENPDTFFSMYQFWVQKGE
jgi:tetratricopeptide (TPR) repeat protein/SAM-dependent methyltransferase